MKNFQQLLQEASNRKDGASIWTNPKIEEELRKVGFDIPKHPKEGPVKFEGKEVGFMDNWNGLTIYTKEALQFIQKKFPKLGVWNPGKAK